MVLLAPVAPEIQLQSSSNSKYITVLYGMKTWSNLGEL